MPTKRQRFKRGYDRYLDFIHHAQRDAAASLAAPLEFRAFEQVATDLVERGISTTHEICLRAESADEETRSVEAAIATSNPVTVFDYERMEAVDEILVIGGMRDVTQVAFLDAHERFMNESVFGSIRSIRKSPESGEIIGRVMFMELPTESERAVRIEEAWHAVRQGHQRDISAGYRAIQAAYLERGASQEIAGRNYTAGDRTLKVSFEWSLRECSLVPIGADPQSTIRSAAQPSSCPATRGEQLAGTLNGLIDNAESEDYPRPDIVSDMGQAAGIDSGTVNQILNAEINCPPIDRLEGFASVLNTSLDRLVDAAEADGCTYD